MTWGEISPLLEARVDLDQYSNAVKTLENFHVLQQGGATKKPGTRFIQNIGTPTHLRLLPFSPTSTDNYILLLTPSTMYFFKNDSQVRTYPTTKSATIARVGNVATATVTAHGYADGDYVQIAGAAQTDYNGIFCITNITTNAFDYIVQNAPTSPATGTITAAVGVAVSLSIPYAGADLASIKCASKNDVMYLAHKSYAPRKLSRFSDTSWTLSTVVFDPMPTIEDTFDSASNKTVSTITYVTTTATATVTAHGYIANSYITVSGATPSQYNGTFLITNITANTFDYTMTSNPGSNASGTIICSGATLKPGATTGDNIVFVAGDNIFYGGDIGRTIVYGDSQATIVSTEAQATSQDIKTISSLTRSGYTATATSNSHGFSNGDKITVLGADQSAYNDTATISGVTTNTFDYTLDSKPTKPATGTLVCYKSASSKSVTSITRSGSVATATVTAHGYADGDNVEIKGAGQTEYNGSYSIYNVDDNEFDYTITGTPTTPATGTIRCKLDNPTNVVVVDISYDFPDTNIISSGAWYIEGSPQAEITFSERGPINSIITITSDKGVFRSSDVGKYIKTARLDGGSAVTKITKFKDKRKIKGEVLTKLSGSDSKTIIANAWTMEVEAWSDTKGYPSAVGFFQERLYFGRTTTIWGSESGGYENFADGTRDDDALSFTLDAPGRTDIVWILGDRGIAIGSTGREWDISGSADVGITPTAILVRSYTNYGTNYIDPVKVGSEVLFIQRTGEKVRAMGFDFGADGFLTQDLALSDLAEHITDGGIVDMAYQQEPYSIVYMVRSDGVLLAMTYNKYQKILGWSRYTLADSALYKNVAVIPHPDGNRDQVWLAVKHGSNYHIEILCDTGYYGNINVDNAFVYSGASISKVIGLSRFNSKTVNIVVDGLKQASQVVSNGTVDLSPGGTKIEIGLPFTSTLKTLRPEIQTETGSRQGKQVRWSEILVRLNKTIKLKVEDTNVDSLGNTQFTGDIRVANLGWDRDGSVTITHDEPYPCTVLGIIGNLTYAD